MACKKGPLLSVIIPTHARPVSLPRAIRSALLCAPMGDVEVIVVPNGTDESWKDIAETFKDDRRVRWEPITKPHANAARNHGLALVQGKFVRFLDDDDFVFPDACQAQFHELIEVAADLSSGNFDTVTESGRTIGTYLQPEVDDFTEGTLGPYRRPQTGAHLYRREVLDGLRWDENCDVGQDTMWMIQLAGSRELKWIRHQESVAAWVQHRGIRISRGRDPGDIALKSLAEQILWAVDQLASGDRITDRRLKAASEGLWALLQKGLRYDFRYWQGVGKKADSLYDGCRPPSGIHKMPIVRSLRPLLVEAALIPVREVYHPIRQMFNRFGFHRG